uniref:Uncharacterized protein n=1 Tax=Arundo donax TaxID=35708 RepID=A0A0A9BMX6_ARUDO
MSHTRYTTGAFGCFQMELITWRMESSLVGNCREHLAKVQSRKR